MQESQKIIKFSAVCTGIFGIITYFISVNMEISLVVLNSIWISNNFLLTIMGGAFASFLVTLIIECKNYISKKRETEVQLFFQTFYLYQQLFFMHRRLSDYINHPDQVLPKGVLNDCAYKVECQKNAILGISYDTFRRKNSLKKAHDDFRKNVIYEIDRVIGNRLYLDIAINNAKINAIKSCSSSDDITSATEPVNVTIRKLQNDIEALNEKVSCFLKNVDKCCNNRYKWDELKASVHSSYKSICEFETFKEYIQQDE